VTSDEDTFTRELPDSLVSNSVLEKEYRSGRQTRRKHKCLHPTKYIICRFLVFTTERNFEPNVVVY
jgi:hypothetical protein